MGLIIAVVFMGVFSVITLLAVATGTGASQRTKQALASLDSALATESPAARDQILNPRKDELLSAIPWLNKKLSPHELSAAPTQSSLNHIQFVHLSILHLNLTPRNRIFISYGTRHTCEIVYHVELLCFRLSQADR